MNESAAGREQGQWVGPQPREVASGVRTVGQVVAESSSARISVLELRKYSNGCVIEVEATATTGDQVPGEILRSGMSPSDENDQPPPAVLRFSVIVDGTGTASTLDHAVIPSSEPEKPYLAVLGGPGFKISGNQLQTRQSLWLWPFPEINSIDLVAEWPIFDISASAFSVVVSNEA